MVRISLAPGVHPKWQKSYPRYMKWLGDLAVAAWEGDLLSLPAKVIAHLKGNKKVVIEAVGEDPIPETKPKAQPKRRVRRIKAASEDD